MTPENKTNQDDPIRQKTHFMSVKAKLIIWFLLLGSVPSIGVGLYAIQKQSFYLENEGIQSRGNLLYTQFQEVRAFLNEFQFDLKDITGRVIFKNFLDAIIAKDTTKVQFWKDTVQQGFARFMNVRNRYSAILFIDLQGNEVFQIHYVNGNTTVQTKDKLRNVSDDPVFKDALSKEEGQLVIAPIMAFNTKVPKYGVTKPSIRYGKPVFSSDGQKMGVVILTASVDKLLSSFCNVSKGKILLLERSGYLLNHPDLNVQTGWATHQKDEKFQDYYSNAILVKMLETGIGVILDHDKEVLSYQKFNFDPQNPNDIWIGVYAIDREVLMAPVTEFRNNFLIILLSVITLVAFIAIVFGKNMTRSLEKVAAVAVAIKEGRLNKEKLDIAQKDEIGVLAHTFDTMVDTLRRNIQSMGKMADELNSSSSEISAAVQQQSAVASQQSTSLTEITATLEELTSSSAQIADNSSSVVDISAVALEQSEIGMTSIEEIKSKMEEITNDNRESAKEIVELGRKSRDIGKVMEIINNIADQTKLIAFNAAIEASSAGEAGKRFGVVAVEIRQLADNVMNSTEDITQKIEEIQEAIHKLVIASEKGAKNITEGNNLALQTLARLRDMVSGSKSTQDAARQISHSTQQQMTATEQVLTALREIEKGIQQSSASIKQISSITHSLTGSSKVLKNLVGEYKIN